MTTMVQVYECEDGSRRPTHRLPFGKLMTYAIERLSASDVVQLRNDLAVLGCARIGGAGGRWHEYVLTNG